MIQDQLNVLRKDLLDVTLRNKQLKLTETKARGLTISSVNSVEIVESLTSSKKYQFLDKESLPKGKGKLHLHTDYTEAELEKRLAGTLKEAKSFKEEQGINTLFLTVGALKWFDDDKIDSPILSPLLMLDVELVKDKTAYELKCEDTDLKTNVTLQIKMKEFGLTIPDFDDNATITDYFDAIKAAVSLKKGWEILPNEMRINLFSFQKLLMYNDLNNDKWTEGCQPADNFFIQTLLNKDGDFQYKNDNRAQEVSDNDAPFSFDDLPISAIDHVLDADSSQAYAIDRIFKNKAFVIQGPPGTGKSQTIVNIIAACIQRGKTVLFVAEKLAALQVVHSRLTKVGLGESCLELHSEKANRKTVLQSIKQTLDNKTKLTVSSSDRKLTQLDKNRRDLNEYSTELHRNIGKTTITPYHAIGKILSIQTQLPNANLSNHFVEPNTEWTQNDIEDRYDAIKAVCAFAKENTSPQNSPFVGTQKMNFTTLEKRNLEEDLKTIQAIFNKIIQNSQLLAQKLELPKPHNFITLQQLLATAELLAKKPNLAGVRTDLNLDIQRKTVTLFELGKEFHTLKAKYKAQLMPDAHRENFNQVKYLYETKGKSWWSRTFSSDFKAAKQQLLSVLTTQPSTIDEAIELATALVQKNKYANEAAELTHIIKKIFTGADDWHFENDSEWLQKQTAIDYMFKLEKACNNEEIHTDTIEKLNIDSRTFKTEIEALNNLSEL
jgi:Protein of unknown function (DUF4011)/AAA domain